MDVKYVPNPSLLHRRNNLRRVQGNSIPPQSLEHIKQQKRGLNGRVSTERLLRAPMRGQLVLF